jgi:hypothetical protein
VFTTAVLLPDRAMGNWLLFLLLTAAALLFRWQGDSWLVTVAKLSALVVLSLLLTTVLSSLMAWL